MRPGAARCGSVRPGPARLVPSGPVHSSDKQPDLTETTLAAPIPSGSPARAHFCCFGGDFGAQLAPTWPPSPSQTFQKPAFSSGFHTFHTGADFAQKSSQRAENYANMGPRPAQWWSRWPPGCPKRAPYGPQRCLGGSILSKFGLLFRTLLGLTARMAPRWAPRAPNR